MHRYKYLIFKNKQSALAFSFPLVGRKTHDIYGVVLVCTLALLRRYYCENYTTRVIIFLAYRLDGNKYWNTHIGFRFKS